MSETHISSCTLSIKGTEGDRVYCPLCLQGESGEELSPVSADFLPDLSAGQRTSVCSTGSEDTMPSPITRQLSGSKCPSVRDSRQTQRLPPFHKEA